MRDKLISLELGDIFNARYYPLRDDDPRFICMVMSRSSHKIFAKTVTTQWAFEFDLETGEALSIDPQSFENRELCARLPLLKIQSVEQPPVAIKEGLLSIDRKYRFDGRGKSLEEMRLTKDEIEALCFLNEFYKNNSV
jgi:hypothetical protein